MKTAGIALSIIGTVFALITALIFLASVTLFGSSDLFSQMNDTAMPEFTSIVSTIVLVLAVLLGICVIMGVIASVKINKKGITAGILLVISAVVCALTVYGILAAVCFLLAGIFSFVADKQSYLNPVPTVPFNYAEDDDPEEYDMGI